MKDNKKEHFSKSIGYLFISQGLIKILGLTYSLYLINKPRFGDEGNAIYLSGYQIFALMLTFSSIGVPNAVSNLVAKGDNYSTINKIFKSAIYIYLFIACISSVLLFIFSEFIASKIIGIETVSYNLKILSPIIIVTTLESIYIGFFNGIKQMKITAKIQFIEQLVKTILTIFLVELFSKCTNSPEILSLGATIGVAISIITSLVCCFLEKRKVEVFYKNFNKNNIRYKNIILKLLKFSIPISIGAMLVGINRNIDSYSIMNLLANKIGKDNAHKIYGIIASKVDVLILFPMAFNITFSTALIPNISEARKNNDFKSIRTLAQDSIFMSLVIGIISTLGLYFFADNIFSLLFSNAKNGKNLLKLASFSIIFSVLNQTFVGLLQGFQKNKIPVFASIVGTISKVFFNIILVTQDSFLENGIIISTIISNIFMFMILYFEVSKIIKFHFKRYILLIFISGMIMVAIISVLQKIFIFIGITSKISFIISSGFGGIVFLLQIVVISKYLGIFWHQNKNNKNA